MKKYFLLTVSIFSLTFLQAQTLLNGDIYSDTVLTLAASPYIVDTLDLNGVKLTIEAGVVIKFNDAGIIRLLGNGAHIAALGTNVDSITFTSNSSSPFPGIYNGIKHFYTKRKSEFDYCNFRFADKAISNGAYWDTLDIRHSVFRDNNTGVHKGSWGPHNNIIDSCTFLYNYEYALNDMYSTTISNCLIAYNGTGLGKASGGSISHCIISWNQNGIRDVQSIYIDSLWIHHNLVGLSFDNSQLGNQSIFNSIFEYNQIGIRDTLYGNNRIRNCIVRYNQTGWIGKHNRFSSLDSCIIVNNQTGIYNGGHEIEIRNTRVDSNTIVGIYFDSLANNCSVINCSIRYNTVGIIGKGGSFSNLFSRNIIENNNTGIKLYNSIDNFYCNRICNNSSYALIYNNVNNTSLTNNYWCFSDSVDTEAFILDGNETNTVGRVQIYPLDTLNCYLCKNGPLAISLTYPSCPTCTDGVATVNSNGIPPFTYYWNTNPVQTTQTASGFGIGIYYMVCVSDSSGCTDCDTVYFYPNVSVNELSSKNPLTVYPNPFSSQTTFHSAYQLKNASLFIYDGFGENISEIKNLNGQTINFSRKNLETGIYYAVLNENNQIIGAVKFVVLDN